jgi:hypothetical protein
VHGVQHAVRIPCHNLIASLQIAAFMLVHYPCASDLACLITAARVGCPGMSHSMRNGNMSVSFRHQMFVLLSAAALGDDRL